jgi:hypothetical protein
MIGIYLIGLFVIFGQDNNPSSNMLFLLVFAFICVLGLTLPLGLLASILAYPAGAHTAAKQQFSAGFRIGEWWPILWHNLGGFALMIGITYVISFLFTILMQIMYITIILACLLPLFMPAYLFYMILVTEPMAAQAYREGREKAAQSLLAG